MFQVSNWRNTAKWFIPKSLLVLGHHRSQKNLSRENESKCSYTLHMTKCLASVHSAIISELFGQILDSFRLDALTAGYTSFLIVLNFVVIL